MLPTLFLYSPSLPIGLLWSVTHLYFLLFAQQPHPLIPLHVERDVTLNKSIHHIFHINYQHFFINMYLFKQISKYFPRFFSFIFFSFSLPFGEDRRGLSSKHFIIFIKPALVFQRKFFPHRKIFHFINIQYPF